MLTRDKVSMELLLCKDSTCYTMLVFSIKPSSSL